MNIEILCVGRLREKFYQDAAEEYLKRLSRYAKVRVLEVEEAKKGEKISPAGEEIIRGREAEKLLKLVRPGAYVVTLEISGKELSSEELAREISRLMVGGTDTVQFVIGGAIGLGKEIIRRADYHLSFSRMTFPHQLMRVILLEQVYRSFRIINSEPYHK